MLHLAKKIFRLNVYQKVVFIEWRKKGEFHLIQSANHSLVAVFNKDE